MTNISILLRRAADWFESQGRLFEAKDCRDWADALQGWDLESVATRLSLPFIEKGHPMTAPHAERPDVVATIPIDPEQIERDFPGFGSAIAREIERDRRMQAWRYPPDPSPGKLVELVEKGREGEV